jgi:uncharacterized membrane protein YdbT with pleckstrin-like domain
MPYPRKLLNDNETVALDVHPHWWYFAEPAAALLAFLVIGVIVAVMSDSDGVGNTFRGLAVLLIVGCAVWFVIRYLKWRTTNFVITSDRVIFRQGIFAKHGIEIPLERVNNVNFHQRIFERIIGAGDLLIESAGQDGRQRFTDVRHPDKVQNLIHVQMESNQTRMFSGQGAASTDVATQLEKLEGMLHRGSLSQEEFDAQKRKLLGA